MPTIPPTLTAPPDVPLRSDRATFPVRAENWTLWEKNFHYTQLTAFGAAAYANAVESADNATSALNSKNSAASSETNSAVSAASALANRITVEQIYDQFDDRYLGPKSADPAVDNDGNALVEGAFYINTVNGAFRGYTIANGWTQGLGTVAGVTSINGLQGAVELDGYLFYLAGR